MTNEEINWFELHDEVPRVASVIMKYKEIYTDEVLNTIFTPNDIKRLNDYMTNHDIDDNHLKEISEHCQSWILSQMPYGRGRPTYDMFIQGICHNCPALLADIIRNNPPTDPEICDYFNEI